MPRVSNPVAKALADSITNERYGKGGIVSANDAKKIVKTALEDIKESEKPLDAFKHNSRFIEAAKDMLGKSDTAARTLESYSDKGMSAVHARMEALTGDTLLPSAAKAAFEDYADWPLDLNADALSLSNVKGSEAKGYSFDFTDGDKTGKAFMLKYEGAWLASPVKIDKQLVDTAMVKAREYFDDVVVPMLEDWGADNSPAEYREMRDNLRAGHVVVGDDDPDKTDEAWEEGFPQEMDIRGSIGCDGGAYVSFDTDAGTYNAFGRYA